MIKSSKKNLCSAALPWVMFSVAALFYCFVYFLRVSPGMMSTEIQQSLHITATKFSILLSFYFMAYAPMQLVVGTVIDRYGARIVLFCASMICLTGVYIFASANSFYLACAARFMIGLGSAFGYVTILKVASIWLPPSRFAAAAGLTTAFGMVAAIFTESYLAKAVEQSGVHGSLTSSLIVGCVLALIIVTILRNSPKSAEQRKEDRLSSAELKQGYLRIIRNPQSWYIGLVGALFYIPAMVFLDAYAPKYLQTAYHLTRGQAAHIINCMFAGWIIGAPIIGAISDHIKRRKLPLIIASVTATLLISLIFYVPNLPMPVVFVSMVLLGISCGAHPLVFALGKENSNIRLSGTATAFTNFLVMSGGLSLTLVGKLVDWHWSGAMLHGAPNYTTADYNFGLSVIPLGLILAVFLASRIKETYARMPGDDQNTDNDVVIDQLENEEISDALPA